MNLNASLIMKLYVSKRKDMRKQNVMFHV